MNIEHLLFVFHGFTKARTPKRKDHAQDGETLSAKISRSQRPAILPWSLCFEWRPSFRWYGHLARYAQPPDCDWTRRADHTKSTRKRAREMRAQTVLNGECCAFRAAPCNAPHPSA